MDQPADLKRTPLHALHVELGAKMVPFAGYDMPVQYPTGILTEHLHTRSAAGLFDVSHMGQCWLSGPRAQAMLESLTTADLDTLAQTANMLVRQKDRLLENILWLPVLSKGARGAFDTVNKRIRVRDWPTSVGILKP